MQEWCSKWQIHVQLGDLRGEDSILDGLRNLCDNTKMFAIASVAQLARRHAIAKAKSSKSRSSLLLSLSQSRSNASSVNCPLIEVSDEMLDAVERLLDDGTEHVRVPAAIMLYCMDRQSEKVHIYCQAARLLASKVCCSVPHRNSLKTPLLWYKLHAIRGHKYSEA